MTARPETSGELGGTHDPRPPFADAIATHAGLRGRPGVELTDDVIDAVVAGFVELLDADGHATTISLARDERAGGVELAARVARAASSAGADVVDFGVAATPKAKLATRRRGLAGGVIVTGSHLEPDWNGLKLFAAPLYGPVDVRTVPRGTSRATRRAGRVCPDAAAAAEHAEAVCAAVDAEQIRAAGLRAWASGGAGHAAALALEGLGCRRLAGAVGLVLDADADRLRLVDEHGRHLDPELTLALVARARRPRCVVKGADTSRAVDLVAAEWGGRVVTVPAGELHLVRGVVDHDGDLAGEGNGGIVVTEVGLARDGLAAAAVVLELLASTGKELSQLAGEVRLPPVVRSTVPCESADAALPRLRALAAELGGGEVTDPLLGVDVERAGARVLARLSATEPVLRITVEGATTADTETVHRELRGLLTE